MKKWLAAVLILALALCLLACNSMVTPEIQPDISKAAKVTITRSGKDVEPGEVTLDTPEQMTEVRAKINAMKWEFSDQPLYRDTVYRFQWFDAAGNSMGEFFIFNGEKPGFFMDNVNRGGGFIKNNSFDFNWLNGLFE